MYLMAEDIITANFIETSQEFLATFNRYWIIIVQAQADLKVLILRIDVDRNVDNQTGVHSGKEGLE